VGKRLAPITVLVTGGGAPGVAGTFHALRNNPEERPVRIVCTDIKPDPVGKYLADRFHRVPAPEEDAYLDALISICEKEEVDAILPQTTREIFTLSKHKQEIEDRKVAVVVSSYDSILKANDKYLLLQECGRVKVPHPVYFLVSNHDQLLIAAKRLGYPAKKVVIKPRVSSGMRGFRIVSNTPWTLERFLMEKPEGVEITLETLLTVLPPRFPDMLVTEYLPGPEYTIDVFRIKDRFIAIPRLRESVRSGITFDARVELRDDLISYARQLSNSLNLVYCFGFQFKLDDMNTPKILEANPRVQGTMVVSSYAGFNMIYWAVAAALGFEVKGDQRNLRGGLSFKRYWGGIAVENESAVGRV